MRLADQEEPQAEEQDEGQKERELERVLSSFVAMQAAARARQAHEASRERGECVHVVLDSSVVRRLLPAAGQRSTAG